MERNALRQEIKPIIVSHRKRTEYIWYMQALMQNERVKMLKFLFSTNGETKVPHWWAFRVGCIGFSITFFAIIGFTAEAVAKTLRGASLTISYGFSFAAFYSLIAAMYGMTLFLLYVTICNDIRRINSFAPQKVVKLHKYFLLGVFWLVFLFCNILSIQRLLYPKTFYGGHRMLPLAMDELVGIIFLYVFVTSTLGFIPSRKTWISLFERIRKTGK